MIKIPKARQLPSGNWFIQLSVNGKRISKTCETEDAVTMWARSYKETYARNIHSQTNYEKLIRGISEIPNKESSVEKKDIPTVATELEIIDSMDGISFEKYCANLFLLTGFFNGANIHLTRKSGDYGADIIIDGLDGLRVSIQCKREKGKVGVSSIQEVVASKLHYRTNAAGVITNSYFTPAAKELAKENGVALIDRRHLIKLIKLKIDNLDRITNSSQWANLLHAIDLLPLKKR